MTSTLCHVPGSALEAFFSGRHEVQKDDQGRIFVDRNPEAFGAVIDLIRNGGRIIEDNPSRSSSLSVTSATLMNELNYWGISLEDF